MPAATAAVAHTATAEDAAAAMAARAGGVFHITQAVVDDRADEKRACHDEVVGVAVHGVLLKSLKDIFLSSNPKQNIVIKKLFKLGSFDCKSRKGS